MSITIMHLHYTLTNFDDFFYCKPPRKCFFLKGLTVSNKCLFKVLLEKISPNSHPTEAYEKVEILQS